MVLDRADRADPESEAQVQVVLADQLAVEQQGEADQVDQPELELPVLVVRLVVELPVLVVQLVVDQQAVVDQPEVVGDPQVVVGQVEVVGGQLVVVGRVVVVLLAWVGPLSVEQQDEADLLAVVQVLVAEVLQALVVWIAAEQQDEADPFVEALLFVLDQ